MNKYPLPRRRWRTVAREIAVLAALIALLGLAGRVDYAATVKTQAHTCAPETLR